MKKVFVATVDARKFVEDLLKLGASGAVITDECIAYKGMFLRAEVFVEDNVVVETNERVKVSADYVAKKVEEMQAVATEKKEPEKVIVEDRLYSKEELEDMTIKQVKEITGANGRDKAKMIEEYLEKQTSEE